MHKCEHTETEWRIVPALLIFFWAIMLKVNVLGESTIGIGLSVAMIVWLAVCLWLGHPWLPKKWL